MHDQPYEIRASRRRKRTIAIFRENGRIVVAVPATMNGRYSDSIFGSRLSNCSTASSAGIS